MQDQVLDRLEIERERGITVKAQAVRMDYTAADGRPYVLNLLDTPGHVDFTYEVSRSLAACEGAILVVDASQGVEAQTVANYHLALEANLTMIPVINKIDLPSADPARVTRELEELGFLPGEVILASAKEGVGVRDILEAVVGRVPPPGGSSERSFRALVFDSRFDQYKGVVPYLRVMEGVLRPGAKVRFLGTQTEFTVNEVGYFRPEPVPAEALQPGEVGYLAAAIKSVRDARVGDTVAELGRGAPPEPLAGYRPAVPMVFAGLYPVDSDDYGELREALEKLQLNDAALSFEPETSAALGFGFRAGFLGLLHLEIVMERLEREYGLSILATAPSVPYRVTLNGGDVLTIHNPVDLPSPGDTLKLEEPVVEARIIVPAAHVGPVMELIQERRGLQENMEYLEGERVALIYQLPLGEIMYDFFDQLKSRSRGYATLDYRWRDYAESDLVKVDILLNGESVDAFSSIVHRKKAYARGKAMVERLRELIPRQMFEIPIQAAIGGRVLARETVRAMRKDVLAKCYGGDITRKKKLLAKQKEGKEKMKRLGSVEIPRQAFTAILKLDD